jgi:hypothetical protein
LGTAKPLVAAVNSALINIAQVPQNKKLYSFQAIEARSPLRNFLVRGPILFTLSRIHTSLHDNLRIDDFFIVLSLTGCDAHEIRITAFNPNPLLRDLRERGSSY